MSTTKPSNQRAKYTTWKSQDWIKFLMEFNKQYPDRNPLDEKFRLREQEFKTVQDAVLADRKRPVYPSVLERATKTIRRMSFDMGSLYSTPANQAGVSVSTPKLAANSGARNASAGAKLSKSSKAGSQSAPESNIKMRWKQDEWISIAIALHYSNPEKDVLNSTTLDFISPEDVFGAQIGLPRERQRSIESIASTMDMNRTKLISVLPVARARTRGFAPPRQQAQESLLPNEASEAQAEPAKAPAKPLAVRKASPAAAAAPAAPAEQAAAVNVAPAADASRAAPAATPAAEPVAAKQAVQVPAEVAPQAPAPAAAVPLASGTVSVTQQEMSTMAEVMRPFVSMLLQEFARAVAGIVPASVANNLKENIVNDVVRRMGLVGQPDQEGQSQRRPANNDFEVSADAAAAIAGRKMADAPSTYGGRTDAPAQEAGHADHEQLDKEINGNVAPPAEDKVLDDIDRQILQNPLAYLGKNDKIAQVAVVGIKWRQQKALQEAFPQIEFTLLDGEKDVQVASLSRCTKVIGVSSSLKPNVDKMLASTMPTRYSTADSIEGVKKELNRMISNGDFLRNHR